MPRIFVPEGSVFHNLTVLSSDPEVRGVGRRKRLYYLCLCTCGSTKRYEAHNLRSGKSKSCGCEAHKATSIRAKTHGMSSTPIYAIWNMMKQRCLVPTYRLYKDYGGRGITVCERWKSFELFYADVGDPPFKGASLERINNDGNYEPGNVKWATRLEQNRNRRNTKRFDYAGKSLTIPEWSELTGIRQQTLASRLYLYGWSVEDALTKPVVGARQPGRPALLTPNPI